MRVLITGDSTADRDACRQTVRRLGMQCDSDDSVPLPALRMRLTRSPAVQAVLVVVDGTSNDWAAVRLAAAGTVPVYAVGPDGLAEAAAAAGAAGYFRPDNLRERLLGDLGHDSSNGRPGRRGRAVVVTGAQPGSGVTTVAAGLAFALADKHTTVGLVELTNSTPDLALSHGLTLRHSIADLIRESARMDARMIQSAAATVAGGPDVIAYQDETLAPEPVEPRQVEDFLVLFRSVYDWSVFDVGHGPTAAVQYAAAHADLVLVVTPIDAPGIRLTRAFVKHLSANGLSADRVKVVANRYGQKGQMDWRKADEALKGNVLAWVPDDPGRMNKARNVGEPPTGGAVARECRKLAKAVRDKLPAR